METKAKWNQTDQETCKEKRSSSSQNVRISVLERLLLKPQCVGLACKTSWDSSTQTVSIMKTKTP